MQDRHNFFFSFGTHCTKVFIWCSNEAFNELTSRCNILGWHFLGIPLNSVFWRKYFFFLFFTDQISVISHTCPYTVMWLFKPKRRKCVVNCAQNAGLLVLKKCEILKWNFVGWLITSWKENRLEHNALLYLVFTWTTEFTLLSVLIKVAV